MLDHPGVTAEDMNAISNENNCFTIFHQAVAKLPEGPTKRNVLLAMIKKGAFVDAVSRSRRVPLDSAAFSGYDQTVALLLANGANPNGSERNTKRHTPLHTAVWRGKKSIAQLLIDAGADVNSVATDKQLTPLHKAASHGFSRLIQLLILHGANPDAEDIDGNRAVDLIEDNETLTVKGKEALIQVLKQAVQIRELSNQNQMLQTNFFRFQIACSVISFLVAIVSLFFWSYKKEDQQSTIVALNRESK